MSARIIQWPAKCKDRKRAPKRAMRPVDREALTLEVIAADVRRHHKLEPDVWERLVQAVARLGEFYGHSGPGAA